MTRQSFSALLALLLLGPLAAFGQTRELSSRGTLIERIVAVVGDGVILKSQLDAETERIIARLRERNTELPPRGVLRQQVLERLIVQEIQLQRAARVGIQVSDEMLNASLEDIAQRNNIPFSQLPAALATQGIDYREFREDLRRDIAMQLLRQRDVVARINVSPRELEQFLARQATLPDQNAQYNLAHILVSVPTTASEEQVAAREARAKEAYDKLKSGADFAQIAVVYSDSSTNVEGGSLGWRKGAELPSIVVERIPGMKPGDITEPIRTPSGFHIFKLVEVRGGEQQTVVPQVHARHILLRPNELEDDNTVKQRLEKIRERIVVGKEDFGAIAAVTSQDPGSAPDGGDLGWAGPGTFVPEFEQQLDQLNEGEVSQPFKTKFGWHLIQLLGRRMHDVTDDVRRQRAYQALRDAKAEEETELWIRRLRSDAYVEIRL